MRLALIICDAPPDHLVGRYGDYKQFFVKFLDKSGYQAKIEAFDLYNQGQLPDLIDSYDGIIISGSKWSVNDHDDWIVRLIGYVRKHWKDGFCKVPLIGICFGHQVVARAFDALVIPRKTWEVGWTELKILTEEGYDMFEDRAVVRIESMHKEEVPSIPDGLYNVASSKDCPVQAFYSDQRKILTFQGHPEIEADYIYELAKFRLEMGTISSEVLEYVKMTRDHPIDQELISRSIMRFLLRYRD